MCLDRAQRGTVAAAPAKTPLTAWPTTPPPSRRAEAADHNSVRGHYPGDDATLLKMGRGTCNMLRGGVTTGYVVPDMPRTSGSATQPPTRCWTRRWTTSAPIYTSAPTEQTTQGPTTDNEVAPLQLGRRCALCVCCRSASGSQFDASMAEQLEVLCLRRDIVRRRRLVQEALAARPGERVLDVGCGSGFYVTELLDQVGREGSVTGVDRAPAMLAVAAKRAEGPRQRRVLRGRRDESARARRYVRCGCVGAGP